MLEKSSLPEPPALCSEYRLRASSPSGIEARQRGLGRQAQVLEHQIHAEAAGVALDAGACSITPGQGL